jgi:hypothetical protein
MKLGYFQIFLSPNDQYHLFAKDKSVEPRKEFLSRFFRSGFTFVHRKKTYHYAFVYENDQLIQGRIGRSIEIDANEGPERRLEPAKFKHWKAYDIFVDTRDVVDGQKILAGPLSGNLVSIFDSLANIMTENTKFYIANINPIVEKSTFWEAYRSHIGDIKMAKFLFVAPNIWGARDRLNAELKQLALKNNVQTVEVDYSNAAGNLKLDGEEISEAVDYAVDGGGSVSLYSKGGKIFDSRNKESIKSVNIDEDKGFVTKIFAKLRSEQKILRM